MRCLSGGLSANRIPDGLMPLPFREAVAPLYLENEVGFGHQRH
jgi:hypothetical protein